MIILHAGLLGDKFLLWGEQSLKTTASPGKRQKRSTQMVRPALFPYGTPAQDLLSALHASGVLVLPTRPSSRPMQVWLPTVESMPVPSSPMIANQPDGSGNYALVPWMITTCSLLPEEALDLLGACLGKLTLTPGILVGQDLTFWTTALRFAGSLVARQQFLPGLVKNQETYRACWEPVLVGTDAEQLAQLSKEMPAVARSLSPKADSPPVASSSSVLACFLTLMVDWLVRSNLVDNILPSKLETKKKRGRSGRTSTTGFTSLHDRWLQALRTSDGTVEGDDEELVQLSKQIQEWRRPVAASVNAAFRLCFRLEEPDDLGETVGQPSLSSPRDQGASSIVSVDEHVSAGQAANWYVRYLLQPVDDPSLLVPIQEAWATKGRMASLLKRRGGKVQEYALAALGQAAGISAEIERSLQGALPCGYDLPTSGAHTFLTEQAMALEQAGFGVMLPAWWTRKGTKLRLTAHANVKSPKMQGGGGLSLEIGRAPCRGRG